MKHNHTRFFQIDNKPAAIIQYDIAEVVPLARPKVEAVSQPMWNLR